MARLPFSFDQLRDAAGEAADAQGDAASIERDKPTGPRPLTVTQLTGQIKRVLAEGLDTRVRVIGEISNFSNRSHWFFSIKDSGAILRCVCFASSVSRMGFVPRDGEQVVITGRVDFYDAQGSLQIYVDKVEQVGQGALEAQYRALCEELRQLGYFEIEHKKPLPLMAMRIAVVTSRSAAALQDVYNTANRRWPGCRLYLVDVRVQGELAGPEIARAINALSEHGPSHEIDAIILTRGGGSIEDLWAFNERIVADAVFHCRVPVVAAIGHETDTTIAELVADQRCATPTQAAMTLVPDKSALDHQVTQLSQRLTLMMRRHVQQEKQRVQHVANHPAFRRPQRMLDPVRERLNNLTRRLQTALPALVAQRRQQVSQMARHLESVGPRNVLERGFTYTLAPDGRVLRSSEQVTPGDRIRTVTADGEVASTVDGNVPVPTLPAGPAAASAGTRKKKKRSKQSTHENTGSLFG